MRVFLETISFNHGSPSAGASALNIRRNESETVEVPEWQSGHSVKPEDSPAAYAISALEGRGISIQASFSSPDEDPQPILIRAIPDPAAGAASLNPLGSVVEAKVTFDERGRGSRSFTLDGVLIREMGVGVSNITWLWQFRPESEEKWTDLATTRHRIYRILRPPSGPWTQRPFEGQNIHLPWTEVLDYACNWASSAQTADEAARLITHGVFNLGLAGILEYDGCSRYAAARFDCAAFLRRLRGEYGKGPQVNCTDCATVVSTFANALGCELSQAKMGVFFYINPHLRIGKQDWEDGQFDYHELAWKGDCEEDDEVFDACLILDGDDVPTIAPPRIPLLATNLRFGSHQDRTYRFRLAPDLSFHDTDPKPHTKQRRSIGAMRDGGFRRLDDKSLSFLKSHFGFNQWQGLNDPDRRLFAFNFKFRGDELPGWRLLCPPEQSKGESRPAWLESYWRPVTDGSDVVLRIDVHECATRDQALDVLLSVLSERDKLDLMAREGVGSGDLAFADSNAWMLAFTRGNLVCALRNAGSRKLPVYNIARTLDEALMRGARDTAAGDSVTASVPAGTDFPLDTLIPELAGGSPHLKFFYNSGEVLFDSGRLVYRPTAAGEQELTAIGFDHNGTPAVRQLRLLVG